MTWKPEYALTYEKCFDVFKWGGPLDYKLYHKARSLLSSAVSFPAPPYPALFRSALPCHTPY